MRKVIPTVFAKSKEKFDERFEKLIKISKELQMDFMDGRFVNSEGIRIEDVPDLKRMKNRFEAHLMVADPGEWIAKLKGKGFKKVIFHYQAVGDDAKLIGLIKDIGKAKMEPWIAFNPEIKEDEIFWVVDGLKKVSGVLFMGVTPGEEHQDFITKVADKIEVFKAAFPKTDVQVDGGVNPKVALLLRTKGADIINSGSFVSDAAEPKEALAALKRAFV